MSWHPWRECKWKFMLGCALSLLAACNQDNTSLISGVGFGECTACSLRQGFYFFKLQDTRRVNTSLLPIPLKSILLQQGGLEAGVGIELLAGDRVSEVCSDTGGVQRDQSWALGKGTEPDGLACLHPHSRLLNQFPALHPQLASCPCAPWKVIGDGSHAWVLGTTWETQMDTSLDIWADNQQ